MKHFLFLSITLSLLISCGSDGSLSDEEVEKYTNQGKKIAQGSFKELNTQLKSALISGGVREATVFCNVTALPLTQQLSKNYGAKIKRTSLKLRNPANAPDSLERVMLDMYLIMSRMRNPVMVPKLIKTSATEIQFYAPIMIKSETCLKCHGTEGETMLAENYTAIKKHYPSDKAIDYKMGDFRGMWSITLKK